ncbi:MAG: ABC transporter ATP-binding protein [Betaproteobacteria bacterium]|nr:MAG: ABC transporter ATP-binding protein [Betaproteobacteria bacterium]
MSHAIRVENLGKTYLISHQQRAPYLALRDSLSMFVRSLVLRLARVASGQATSGLTKEEFWALRNVNFEVEQGERVGIVGKNGAGKSTLLKLLSRITEPSTGKITISGRVASLLEVGTGFHPELTGRENIFLNGAILGMSKAEIERKFEDIVAFAEVENFLDVPVKRYSSGMYVRLAFAVAAHLEPELLIVDEVLAVGDAAFQKKCLNKMGDVSREGRTVLFVSHNMGAVRQFCDRAIVLDSGECVFDGSVEDGILYYQNNVIGWSDRVAENPTTLRKPFEDVPIWIQSVSVLDDSSRPSLLLEHADSFSVVFDVVVERPSKDYYSALLVHDSYGNNIIFTTDEDLVEPPIAKVSAGHYAYSVQISGGLLKPGTYSITPVVCLKRRGKVDRRDAVLRFEVQDTKTRRGAKQIYRPSAIVAPEVPWVLNRVNDSRAA